MLVDPLSYDVAPWRVVLLGSLAGALMAGCSGNVLTDKAAPESNGMAGGVTYCAGVACQSGFHCEYDACVADTPPSSQTPTPTPTPTNNPRTSNRYVYILEPQDRRLVRIDSVNLDVAAFPAGLAPMTMAVVPGRDITVILDADDVIDLLDHRSDPPISAGWTTARALSHLVVSPTGQDVIAYYDWDDPRAQQRQPAPGNINQVTVLDLTDTGTPFADRDPRVKNVAVGFLPRDVRFAADGSRAVVIARDTMTVIDFTSDGSIAVPQPPLSFDGSATEIVVDRAAQHAMLRYAATPRVDVLDLADGSVTCFSATGNVTDIALTHSGELLVSNAADPDQHLSLVDLSQATASCTPLGESATVSNASRLAVDPTHPVAVAFEPDLKIKTIWRVGLAPLAVRSVQLEKAVAAVAFMGDGVHALLSHMKAPGTPAWDPSVEDPQVSVDKSYGVSWIDLDTGAHRLEVSDVPFGPFAFVPASGGSVTYQTILDPTQPELLRVVDAPGFDDERIELAAMPEAIGYLAQSERTYVTQDHPWGRVTFIDPTGTELRHVTGFALETP